MFGYFPFTPIKKQHCPKPRTGHFRGLVGFKANAKNLSFKAKAKCFKRCPRGEGCKSLLSIGEWEVICNFTPIFHIGGMYLDHDFFHVSNLSEDQKKSLHQKRNTFFPRIQVKTKKTKKGLLQKRNTFFPRIQVETCAQTHTRVKLLEGMQMKTILKLLGGIQSNYWGEYIPPISPPGFGTPARGSTSSSSPTLPLML